MSTAKLVTTDSIDISGLADFRLLDSLTDWGLRANEPVKIEAVSRLLADAGFSLAHTRLAEGGKPLRLRYRRGDVKIEVLASPASGVGPVYKAELMVKTRGSGFATILKQSLRTIPDLRTVLHTAFLPRRPGTRGALPPPSHFQPFRVVQTAERGNIVQNLRCTLSCCQVLWSGGINALDWSISEDQLSVPDTIPWFAIAARKWAGRHISFITDGEIWYRVWGDTAGNVRQWQIAISSGDDEQIPALYELDKELVQSAIEHWFHSL